MSWKINESKAPKTVNHPNPQVSGEKKQHFLEKKPCPIKNVLVFATAFLCFHGES